MYNGHAKVESYLAEADRAVGEIVFSPVPSTEPRPPRPPGHLAPDPYLKAPEMMPPGSFLPTPSALGSGYFLDGPSESSLATIATTPSSPRYTQEMPPYPQIDSGSSRTVDDFGMRSNLNGGFGKDSSSVGGGRFATFPVKNEPRGYTLRDERPPSLNTRHEVEPSFASSVAEALSARSTSSFKGPLPSQNRVSEDEPAPLYQLEEGPNYHPPAGPPPGAAPAVLSPWLHDGNGNNGPPHGHERPASFLEDDAQLAYMTNTEDEGHSHGQDDPGRSDSRHLRFGGVSDIDEELDRRAAPPLSPGGSLNGPPRGRADGKFPCSTLRLN